MTEYSARIGVRPPLRVGSPGSVPPRAASPAAHAPRTNPVTHPATRVSPPGALPTASHGPILFLQPLSPRSLHTPAGHLYKTHLKSSTVIGTSCVRSGVRGGLPKHGKRLASVPVSVGMSPLLTLPLVLLLPLLVWLALLLLLELVLSFTPPISALLEGLIVPRDCLDFDPPGRGPMVPGDCLLLLPRFRLPLLPLAPCGLRAGWAPPPSCRGRARCPSLQPFLRFYLTRPSRSCPLPL